VPVLPDQSWEELVGGLLDSNLHDDVSVLPGDAEEPAAPFPSYAKDGIEQWAMYDLPGIEMLEPAQPRINELHVSENGCGPGIVKLQCYGMVGYKNFVFELKALT
jgi:hypothetical protein